MSDISGLNELIHDLTEAPRKVQRGVDKVVIKGGINVRDDARRLASGNRYAPAYPRSITMEAGWKRGAYEAEIGPEKGGPQWGLGTILEFGVPSKGTAPQPHLRPAADAEEPRFEKAIADLADDAL